MTIGKTENELIAMLNEALRADDDCEDIKVVGLAQMHDAGGRINWDVDILKSAGSEVARDCMHVLIATKLSLQRQFHLLTKN